MFAWVPGRRERNDSQAIAKCTESFYIGIKAIEERALTVLKPEDLEKLAQIRQKIRAEKGLPPLVNPLAIGVEQDQFSFRAPVNKRVAIAALFLLGASYGQLMSLFEVSQGTVYQSIIRHIPQTIKAMRKPGRGRPLIPYELASLYYDRIKDAGHQDNAIVLAAKLKELAKDTDWTE